MKIEQLRYFLEAARHQHIAKAAAIVAISPSAISHSIAALERELGQELFVKKGKNIFLTGSGKLLMENADRFIGDLEAMKELLSSEQAELQGYYRLAATHLICARYLTPAWSTVQAGNPSLHAEIFTLRSAQVARGVAEGEYDFGVCFNPQTNTRLETEPLMDGSLVLAVRKNHPVLKAAPAELGRELSRYPAALPKSFQGIDNCEMHPMFDAFGIKPRAEFVYDSYEIATARLLSSRSWSLIPDWIVALEPGLAAIKPKRWNAPYRVTAVWPRHRRRTRVLNRLCDAVRKLLRSG
ncbi:MAG: LysR family transcriptional regulator [Proteobacteria bacterium]|nr:LysR family transcriptional regulator [Pseudomonadota bacterium]